MTRLPLILLLSIVIISLILHQEPAYNYVSESQKSAKLLWWPSIGRRKNPLITKEAEKYE